MENQIRHINLFLTVIVGNVDVYQMTRVCNIPDEILLVIADSFLVQFGKIMMLLV